MMMMMRGLMEWLIDKTCKRYNESLSGGASRRIALRNVEEGEEEEKLS